MGTPHFANNAAALVAKPAARMRTASCMSRLFSTSFAFSFAEGSFQSDSWESMENHTSLLDLVVRNSHSVSTAHWAIDAVRAASSGVS
eukprot:5218427-Pyramimonas_sp.AAC.1